MPTGFSVEDKIIERKSEYNKNSHATSLTITSKFEKPKINTRTNSKIGEEDNEEIKSATELNDIEQSQHHLDDKSSIMRVKMSGHRKDPH